MGHQASRALLHLAAGLVGFVMGSALIAHPLAGAFGRATVAWDATSCPAGDYTVTSQARRIGSREAYLSVPANVTLPQTAVVLEFPSLPPGLYAVSASVRGRDGRSFGSGVQTITVVGESAAAQPAATSGRRRPASAAPAGLAQPRKGRDQAPSAAAAPASAPQAMPASASARIATTAKAAELAPAWISLSDVEDILVRFGPATDAAHHGSGWRRIMIVDSDADGLTDMVMIEMATGDLWLFRVSR